MHLAHNPIAVHVHATSKLPKPATNLSGEDRTTIEARGLRGSVQVEICSLER
ncbi:unnamed protein product [Brassica oleracea]